MFCLATSFVVIFLNPQKNILENHNLMLPISGIINGPYFILNLFVDLDATSVRIVAHK